MTRSSDEPNILIATLVKNREWILPRFLDYLSHMDYPKTKLGLLFIIDNNSESDKSPEILTRFKKLNGGRYRYITIVHDRNGSAELQDVSSSREPGKAGRPAVLRRLAELRNRAIKSIRPEEEFLFFVDSDILVEQHTLKQLISNDKPVASALIFNDFAMRASSTLMKLTSLENRITNCMRLKDQNEPYEFQHVKNYPLDRHFPVDLTGACVLIHRDVITNPAVKYHNGPTGMMSEDHGFCHDVKQAGFEMVCDPRTNPLHIMTPGYAGMISNIPDAAKQNPPMPEKKVSKVGTNPAPAIQRAMPAKNGRLIIYPPTVRFSRMYQRPQQFLEVFAGDGYDAFFCDGGMTENPPEGIPASSVVPGAHPNLKLTVTMSHFHGRKTMIYVTWPWHCPEIMEMKRKADTFIWYDIIDDNDIFMYSDTPQFKDGVKWLTENADLVTASARSLYDDVLKIRPDAVYVPNGVDLPRFNRANGRPLPVPKNIEHFTRQNKPIFGFYGACAKWVHGDWIHKAAIELPQFNFVVIGPDYDNSFPNMSNIPNIARIGLVDYTELNNYLQNFDVCILPFKFDDITKACSPIKFFEYLITGKPIVASNIPELREHSAYTYLTDDYEGFKRALVTASEENDPCLRAMRMAVSSKFSWTAIYKRFKHITDEWWDR